MDQHDGEGDDMHPGQRLCDVFVVTHQATEARHPNEPALDHPEPRQHDNTPLDRRLCDHLQATASCAPVLLWSTMATYRIASYLLHA